jgi:membrane protein implicated in regulation of membrane protease activity
MLVILAVALLLALPGPWNFVGFAVACALFPVELLFWNRTVKHRRNRVGDNTLIGADGIVLSPCRPEGQVRVNGEIWNSRCAGGAAVGDAVRVVGRDRLTLIVEHREAPNE